MTGASNQRIADKLRELADLLEQQGANPFRVGAYRRAAETAAAHGEELTEVLDRGGFEGLIALPGIGRSIASAIRELAAKRNEPGADLADRGAVVLAKVGNRLVIGNQAAGQPHDFHVAPRFTFQTTARLHPVEVTVDVELQKNRGVIGRSPGRPWRNPVETQAAKIELIDKYINHPNRVVVTDPVFQPIRK